MGTHYNQSDSLPVMMSGMEIRAERERLGLSQAQLAAEVGCSQPAIKKIESGETIRSRFIYEIEQFFTERGGNVSSDLTARRAAVFTPIPSNKLDTMPVFASAEGGNGALIVSTSEIDRVPRPYTLEGVADAYAILVTGESMVPAYEPGDYAWINPLLPPMRGTDCVLYGVDERSGEAHATIKRLLSWTAKTWKLRQWNPSRDFTLDRAKWNRHHRVVGVFRRR